MYGIILFFAILLGVAPLVCVGALVRTMLYGNNLTVQAPVTQPDEAPAG